MRKIVLAAVATLGAVTLAACSQAENEPAGEETEVLTDEFVEDVDSIAADPDAAVEAAAADAESSADASATGNVADEDPATTHANAAEAAAADVEAAMNAQ